MKLSRLEKTERSLYRWMFPTSEFSKQTSNEDRVVKPVRRKTKKVKK